MTVAQLRNDMSAEEFMQWNIYYARESQQRQLAR
jgi:hypothetical protein